MTLLKEAGECRRPAVRNKTRWWDNVRAWDYKEEEAVRNNGEHLLVRPNPGCDIDGHVSKSMLSKK